MEDILIAFVRIIMVMVLMTILTGVILGVPILLAAGVEWIFCVICHAAFDWTGPIIVGVGAFIIVCLIIADTKC